MKWYLKFIVIGSLDPIAQRGPKETNFAIQAEKAKGKPGKIFFSESTWIKEVYTVKSGDFLYRISRQFGTTLDY
jgi:LysM repeat protein